MIRILRVLEYEYDSAEAAAEDMARWTHSHVNVRMKMRSAVLPFTTVEDLSPSEADTPE